MTNRELDFLAYTKVLGLPAKRHPTLSHIFYTQETGLLGYNPIPNFEEWNKARLLVDKMSEYGFEFHSKKVGTTYNVEFFCKEDEGLFMEGASANGYEFGDAVRKAALLSLGEEIE